MDKKQLMLIINLGGTSTKIGVFEDKTPLFIENVRHETKELEHYKDFWDQYDFRRNAILKCITKQGYPIEIISAVVSRGSPVKPMCSSAYAISQEMVNDAKSRKYGNHPCSIGCEIALNISREYGIPALTVDAPCIDELIPEARFTGIPGMERKSYYQALNQKAIGRKLSEKLDKHYNEINAVITHIGSGISIAAHCYGKVIDVTNGLDGDGPMAPERAGTLPAGDLARLCFSGKYTFEEVYSMINGRGGLYAHLSTKEGTEIERRIENGDKKAKEVYDAMAYQIAKTIGGCACSLKGNVDALAFTGGLAYSKYLIDAITQWCSWIAPVIVFPGEDEMESLALGALRVLQGEEPIQQYK